MRRLELEGFGRTRVCPCASEKRTLKYIIGYQEGGKTFDFGLMPKKSTSKKKAMARHNLRKFKPPSPHYIRIHTKTCFREINRLKIQSRVRKAPEQSINHIAAALAGRKGTHHTIASLEQLSSGPDPRKVRYIVIVFGTISGKEVDAESQANSPEVYFRSVFDGGDCPTVGTYGFNSSAEGRTSAIG